MLNRPALMLMLITHVCSANAYEIFGIETGKTLTLEEMQKNLLFKDCSFSNKTNTLSCFTHLDENSYIAANLDKNKNIERISLSFKNKSYKQIKNELIQRYGNPTKVFNGKSQKMSYQITLRWINGYERMTLYKENPANKTESLLVIVTKEYADNIKEQHEKHKEWI